MVEKGPVKRNVICGQESGETENISRKSPDNFQWEAIPGAGGPYVNQNFYLS